MSALALINPDAKVYAPRKLDIACGQNKQKGYTGIDLAGDADIVHDLNVFPWPIKTGAVREVYISHYVEHIPHDTPSYLVTQGISWPRDGWFMFWDEVHRICAPDARLKIIHPYALHARAFWDPTHVRFIHESTWGYLDVNWRKQQGLDHYDVAADFEVLVVGGPSIDAAFAHRSEEVKQFAKDHYWNVYPDLQVELRAKKG